MLRSGLTALCLALAACAPAPKVPEPASNEQLVETPFKHTKTFRVFERGGYRIVDLNAPIVSWVGGAEGPKQSARIVLVPEDTAPPSLTGDLAGATLVRTPVRRIAVNDGRLEAVLTALGVADRLVAVGGVKSYDDDIREKARAGKIAQIGYGWHMPPMIDPLIGAQPDVFLMSLGDLSHADHYERIKNLGIPVMPVFIESEPHYMGPLDYVLLTGLLTGREDDAARFVADVEAKVASIKASVAPLPQKTVISTWFSGGSKWTATVRNLENALLEDANARNLLRRDDDIRMDAFAEISTELLLEQARDVDCWIIRDTHSRPFEDVRLLANFKAWREGCIYASDGMQKPEADAFDYYERAAIRPDLVLSDIAKMLHPELRDGSFTYIRPDETTPGP